MTMIMIKSIIMVMVMMKAMVNLKHVPNNSVAYHILLLTLINKKLLIIS